MHNKCANCDRRIKQQEKEVVKCKNCGMFMIWSFWAKDYHESGKGTWRCPFWESFPRKSKYNAAHYEQNKYQGEIRSRSKNNNGSSVRAKLRKYTHVRVLQKNLVYVIGLSPDLVIDKNHDEELSKPEYFGQYGKLLKIVVNTNYIYRPKGTADPSYGAYVTYSDTKEAALAILGIEQLTLDNRLLRASFGTTKYCSFFLKGQKCLNKECLYLHKWHSEKETYTKEEMSNKKIFSDQLDIAIKLTGISTMSRDEFKTAYEKLGPIPKDSKFPNILQIYDKYCKYEEHKPMTKSTPKKYSSKAEQILLSDSCKNIEEVKIGPELQMSAQKVSKQSKNEKNQLNIESKIDKANNLVIKQKELKRGGSGNNKSRSKSNSPLHKMKYERSENEYIHMHHNPHIQMKDPRIEGDDKRAISSGRRGNYIIPAHSPSTRQPTTAEKYTLFGHSEDSTIWKTPQTVQEFAKAAYIVSPYFFNRNAESRYNFARSMDPREEAEYMNIPEEIQEILERNIRTMSNKAHK